MTEPDARTTWRALLERLIVEQGGIEAVAERLSAARGGLGDDDRRTAARELRNWSSGRSLPSQRAFTLLSQALAVGDSPTRAIAWNESYLEARFGAPGTAAGQAGDSPRLARPGRANPARLAPFLFAALLAAALVWWVLP